MKMIVFLVEAISSSVEIIFAVAGSIYFMMEMIDPMM
jgi:hypothetical protein